MNGTTALLVADSGFPSRALTTRASSALMLAAPVLAAAYAGYPVFELLITIASVAMAWEWYRMCASDAPYGWGFAMGAAPLAAVAAVALSQPALALTILGVAAVLVFLASGRHAWLGAGVLYVGLPCVALVWLRNEPTAGRETIFWLLALVWASDVGAYACGRLIGGPKLAPAVSPNKTWAGLFGAVFCAASVGAATATLLEMREVWRLALISAGLGATAQVGDLLESWVKRRFGVKDSGTLIPGHGGILDRVDALVVVAVITALITAVAKGSMLTWS